MKTLINRVYDKFFRDHILTQAAALALYTAFSLAPLMILLISFLSTLNLSLQNQLIEQVAGLMGKEAASVLTAIIEKAQERQDLNTFAGWAGILTLVLSASAIFAQMQSSLNIIFETKFKVPEKYKKSLWLANAHELIMRRVVSFGMVLTFIFISIVSLLISSALSMFVMAELQGVGELLNTLTNLLVFTILFAAIFKWMPDQKISYHTALRGGGITAILFVLGKTLIGIYLGRTAVGSAYGAAGSFIVLLVWVFYSSLIVFLGAEISAALVGRDQMLLKKDEFKAFA